MKNYTFVVLCFIGSIQIYILYITYLTLHTPENAVLSATDSSDKTRTASSTEKASANSSQTSLQMGLRSGAVIQVPIWTGHPCRWQARLQARPGKLHPCMPSETALANSGTHGTQAGQIGHRQLE